MNFFISVLKLPALLVGLISLIGLISQKKSPVEVISGTFRTIIGFTILNAGADLVALALSPIGKIFRGAFGLAGIVPNNEATVSFALAEYGSTAAVILAIGMLVNIFLARFSRFKYIFLTGHLAFYMSSLLAMLLPQLGYSSYLLYLTGGLILGLLMSILPAIAQPYMRKITGSDEIALGNFGTLGYILSAELGKRCGGDKRSTEEIQLKGFWRFLEDSTVAIALVMTFIYMVIALLAGPKFIEAELSAGQHYLVYALLQSIIFASGIFVIMQGVNMFLKELVSAFTGISKKLVPSAKPALDGPVIYPYAPNAVLIGFVSSFAGGLLALAILILTKSNIVIPGLVAHFFCGASSAVFGNATGGRRGAVIGSFINGLIFVLLPPAIHRIVVPLQQATTTFSDTDFQATGLLTNYLGRLLGPLAFTFLLIGIIFVLVTVEAVHKFKSR
ncbi:MAG: PTS ascorbate transporter subunit IIC [Eubacteriales bacterium]|nr:PTS ascorbate transporter subunit IIC [Eubacteriales bacterium]